MPIVIFIFVSGLLNLMLGVLVFARARSKIQKSFSYLVFLVAFWVFWNVIYYLFPVYPLINLTYAIGSVLLVSILVWISLYSQFVLKIIHKLVLLFATVLMFVIALIPDKFISHDIKITPFGFNAQTGPFFIIFAIPAIIILLLAICLLFITYRRATGLKKLQLSYVMMGFCIPIAIISMIDFVIPIFFGVNSIASLDVTTSFIFVGFVSYAILKYRFMDILVIIRKGVVYFLTIVIVLFLYLYLLFFTQKYFVDAYHWNSQVSIIVFVLIIALTVEPLRRFLSRLVDKVFYSRRKNSREEAKKLRLILSSSLQFDQLIKKIKIELQSFLDVRTAQFIWHNRQSGRLVNYYQEDKPISFSPTDPLFHYLQEHPDILITEEISYLTEEAMGAEQEMLRQIEQTLKKLNVGLVYPVGESGELVGAFLFSPKSHKEAFTSDNVEYLSGLQFQLTGAIMNALLYKQAVERIGKLR